MKRPLLLPLIYAMFFMSGLAALIYETVWFRALSLIFGGAHLAVTTVVAVFMTGLALGNWISGRHLQRAKNLLLLYGYLEIGIALFAGLFLLLMMVYPDVYVPLARVSSGSPAYLTGIRVFLALIAMIIPTTLMGATLPVLTAFMAKNSKSLARHLSFLYGLNTLGAVAGAIVTGFYLLRVIPVSRITFLAMSINIIVGAVSIMLRQEAECVDQSDGTVKAKSSGKSLRIKAALPEQPLPMHIYKLVLWGIGVSGFCALGFEILWTRILILFLDASVYSFTIVLAAFLLGIGLGGISYGFFLKLFPAKENGRGIKNTIAGFGATQILIGLTTIVTMQYMVDMPSWLISWHRLFYKLTGSMFSARQFGNFSLSFILMFIPAFFMGLAVPLSGKVRAHYTDSTGQAAGEVIAYNTIGAILGAVITGFALIYLIGIERSLQFLAAISIGLGALIFAGLGKRKGFMTAAAAAVAGILIFLTSNDSALKSWDTKYLASYMPNVAALFLRKQDTREYLDSKEILYYGEGAESIVSSVRDKASELITFTVNGRAEASTALADVQLQYIMGHLPMLLHKEPKSALVVGMGSGMTLGAVSVHSGLEAVTLVEIEPKVLGVAKTFATWNHDVLDSPKLRIVFNDARNFLMTSEDKFDVITTDPIHPSWRGSGYLYTTEYFSLAAEHLAPGGIICQWLPLYQLSAEDEKSVVKTFSRNFRYVSVWLTLTDIALIGSNRPLMIDTEDLDLRIKKPVISDDLNLVMMGSAADLLSYFVMGSNGTSAYADNAAVNSDDNVHLEFSSPLSIGNNSLESQNVAEIIQYRESIEPYLSPLNIESPSRSIILNSHAPALVDKAHVLYLKGAANSPEIQSINSDLGESYNVGRWKGLKMVLGLNAVSAMQDFP